ncbi:MAG: hypothetical protein JWN51_2846 [Phycisphaerales bacterium]|nr:hypothetical protein [Phycisphaerales bacterium]
MAIYFLDSSALVKRYVAEAGSAWVKSLFNPSVRNIIGAAVITGVEVVAAVARRQRGGSLQPIDASRIISQFRTDFFASLHRIEITPMVIESAMKLAEVHGLRGYDAVQLGAALSLQSFSKSTGLSITFVGSDRKLNAVATAEGLSVEDPNAHQ